MNEQTNTCAIIICLQVDQFGLDEGWPLLIQDPTRDGEFLEVTRSDDDDDGGDDDDDDDDDDGDDDDDDDDDGEFLEVRCSTTRNAREAKLKDLALTVKRLTIFFRFH